jgi:ABC-type polar amino acid transport system ATPase subunit
MKVKELSTPIATAMRLADEYADKVVFFHSQKWKTGEKQNPHGMNKSRELLKSYLKKQFGVGL